MSDAQLLTSASVLLACCGLTHALNVTAEGDGDGGPPALSNSPSRDTTTDGEETDAFESPCGSRELHAAPLGAIKRSAHSTPERSEDTQSEPSQGHQRFSESVWSILRDECTHVHALGRNEFARLCQLLDLPLETGVQWQSRILPLQNAMRELSEKMPPRPPSTAGASDEVAASGECTAAAVAAFAAALEDDPGSARGAVRGFGRQTVWCTVALLRRVLQEAKWQAGDRGLTNAQAESRLASLAVAAIGRAEVCR